MKIKTGIGQDSHRFELDGSSKPLVMGGVHIKGYPGLSGNSDADVVLHALCNAVSGVTGVNILGEIADNLCNSGITDSSVYVQKAISYLGAFHISNISISIECSRPRLASHIDDMKNRISLISGVGEKDIGITATSGEGLTAFGKGEGVQVFVVVTAISN